MFASMRHGAEKIKRRLEKKATVVELALIAPLFFFLLLIIEFGLLFRVNLTMQQYAFSVAATVRNEAFR